MDCFRIRGIVTKIEHRSVELEDENDIRFAFVVRNSLSALDLPRQEERISFGFEGNLISFLTSSILGSFSQNSYIVNAHEKCEKNLFGTRDIFNRLHLDLPKRKECSLKNSLKPKNMEKNCSCYYTGKVTVQPSFHLTLLSSIIKEVIKSSDIKPELLIKWLVTFKKMEEYAHPDNQQVLYLKKCRYEEVIEPALAKAFIKKFDALYWVFGFDKPELLEFFLYLFHQHGGGFENNPIAYEALELCIHTGFFLNFASIFKFYDAPRIPPPRDIIWDGYSRLLYGEGCALEVLRGTEERMSQKRFYLMLVLLHLYLESPSESAVESLHLLWNSLPDVYFSFEEIEMALQSGLSSETIRGVCSFYSRAVGVSQHARVQPRSLKHLCRTSVRRLLWDSGCWIPDGIQQIGVPRELQSFLNLED